MRAELVVIGIFVLDHVDTHLREAGKKDFREGFSSVNKQKLSTLELSSHMNFELRGKILQFLQIVESQNNIFANTGIEYHLIPHYEKT